MNTNEIGIKCFSSSKKRQDVFLAFGHIAGDLKRFLQTDIAKFSYRIGFHMIIAESEFSKL